MKYDHRKIGEFCKVIGGYAFKSGDFINDGVPVLKIKNISDKSLLLDSLDFLPERFLEIPDKYKVRQGDVLISMTGSHITMPASAVGRVARSRCDDVFLLNQRVGKMQADKSICSLDYLYYCMTSAEFKEQIGLRSRGAANQANVSGGDIEGMEIPFPPLPIQQKIAGILAAYDDLIENNLKRIKLLEEMAQITYEEWFVRLRFPGHECTPINPETGLPEGWSKTRLGEMCTLTMGQSPKSEFYNFQGKGLPFHQGVKDYGERFPTNACWSTSGSRYAERGDILFSVRAPVGRLNIALEKMILGRGLAAIRHKENAQGFLYCLLKKQFFEEDMMGGGAIFNSVTKNDMHRIEVVAPSPAILNDFNQIVEATDRQIEILHFQNVRLREARDILLPRLMTGVIDAESYDPAQLLKEAA